ncbi:MAG: lysophospholipid acyltransferase family protein [bacterium]
MAKRKSKFQAAVELALVKGLIAIIGALPFRKAQRFGGRLGVFFHDTVGVRVKHAREELLRAFPDKTEEWAAHTVREVYRHFGTLAVEQVLMPKLNPVIERYVHVDQASLDRLKRAHAQKRGIFMVSCHMGNWENIMGMMIKQGYQIAGVSANQSNEGIDALLDKNREAVGIDVMKRGGAAKGLVRAIKNNKIIAIMLDQDAGSEGVFVPFFGRLASTTRGVATFTLRLNSNIMMMQTWRDEVSDIQVRLHDLKYVPTGDFQSDVVGMTATMTAEIEQWIRQRPEQWLWLHRRWKTRPPEENPEQGAVEHS